ncbi:MAG TPA: hypothetical protein VKX49_02190 [Bryobacteraceae bacterium]|nr:hypothetical protein [Bryobacteraceae bacterium]
MQPSLEHPVPPPAAADRAALNRANAQFSTGPRTEDGKQRASQNATKHGLTSRSPVLRSEDRAAYEQHCQQFRDEYQPQTPTEIQLVQELADTSWRLNRIPRLEAELLDIAERGLRRNRSVSTVTETTRALATLGLHGQRLSRQFNKTLATLRQIQASHTRVPSHVGNHPGAAPRNPAQKKQDVRESGFVFSNGEIKCRDTDLGSADDSRDYLPAPPDTAAAGTSAAV